MMMMMMMVVKIEFIAQIKHEFSSVELIGKNSPRGQHFPIKTP